MNYKGKAIEELKDYNDLKLAQENIRERIEVLNSRLEGIHSACAGESAGGIAKDELYSSLITEKSELEMQLKSSAAAVRIIEKGLNALSKEERIVITAAYINRERGYAVKCCEQLSIEKTALYKFKRSALERYITVVYGK